MRERKRRIQRGGRRPSALRPQQLIVDCYGREDLGFYISRGSWLVRLFGVN
ncbi:hypothetical protein HanRHA438_Chr16g0775141 [Helianthus annuus]|uniref:Uncharacterized protein n=1 Tax=Helianthus annuus TaxID=4232 RepID=A0A251S1S5_HELAN|nr:hypothetical protein HanXRQr2_Chr16g0763961 [Helianthus annuus]KAJ0439223.1 hypothetical protein HanHA300_Chr16g0622871 [Helianthus annuus]KAJ0461568.1 hypothetical protein HanHA89_Chr16g0673721 [Helianthus annuus]KAJ0645864.1 hypothetical protein HanOQP8_Chr16g0628671 [Helianthus annuus]KAJ0822452.1 hypothetical protein HanPSC8_Chr16g0732191 [Helianthus annuus]